jgi:16S rRNA (cytidine1402-2'-O)-methyltransferase
VIACEDTRTSRPLLTQFGVNHANCWAVHEHNERTQAIELANRVQQGAIVALITDAGTPGISDPGARIVAYFREQQLPVFTVPGASAVIAALSIAGIVDSAFSFAGFMPSSRGERLKALEPLLQAHSATVFYESPHRIEDCLQDSQTVLGEASRVFIARELTKRFETTGWYTIGDALAQLTQDANQARGEFVLIYPAAPASAASSIEDALPTLKLLLAELPPTKAVKLAAKITGADKDALYAAATQLKNK